jgi:hypothetical protein
MNAKKHDARPADALENEAKEGSKRLKLSVHQIKKTVHSGVKGGPLLPSPWVEM